MVTSIVRYFVLPEEQMSKCTAMLVPDGDLLPISNLKVIRYPYPVNDGRYIVKAELPRYLIKDMIDVCADYGIDDPLTMEGVIVLDIDDSYVGAIRADVLERFPELEGHDTFVDSDGEKTLHLKFPYKTWSFENNV